MFGVEEFLVNTLLDPGGVKRAMASLKEVAVLFGTAQLEAGAVALCIADHATRDVCSPKAYHEFLVEIHQELAERLPCPLILHICGDTSDRIPDIAGTCLACLHFDSKLPTPAARQLAGNRLSLMGGTSNLDIVQHGSPEAIAADVATKLANGVDIIGPECAVPLNAPWENMKLLAEEAKKGRASQSPAG
jgi:[methyl-Co(III) methanol-specific corrinoid protein]:coenzyme M methyltransferase